jgi:hypothetical protein
MRTDRVLVLTSSALAGLLWAVGPAASAQHQHPQTAGPPPQASTAAPAEKEKELKVGKKGDVTFSVETIVGDLRLKPGRYQIQHRVEGSDHFVHFTELTKGNPYTPSTGTPKAHPGEVRCRVEPLDKKVSGTRLYMVREGEVQRVQRVLIGGENVAHSF